MDDVRQLVEDLTKQLRELVQPAPPPRSATKIAGTSLGAMLLLLVAGFVWAYLRVPTIDSSQDE